MTFWNQSMVSPDSSQLEINRVINTLRVAEKPPESSH